MMCKKNGSQNLAEIQGGWQQFGSNMERYVPKALTMGESIRAARLISGYSDPWVKPFPARYKTFLYECTGTLHLYFLSYCLKFFFLFADLLPSDQKCCQYTAPQTRLRGMCLPTLIMQYSICSAIRRDSKMGTCYDPLLVNHQQVYCHLRSAVDLYSWAHPIIAEFVKKAYDMLQLGRSLLDARRILL